MKKDVIKSKEEMHNCSKEEEKVENERKRKVDKLFINVKKVFATLQVGFFLTLTGTSVYAITKAKISGEEIPKPGFTEEERERFKLEDNELTVPTVHGNTAKIKIRD